MWLVLLMTFLTVTTAIWLLVIRPQTDPAVAAASAHRPIERGNHPLDQTLARLHVPLSRQEFLLFAGLGTAVVGMVAALWSQDLITGLGVGVMVPLVVTVEIKRRMQGLTKQINEQLPDTLMMLANSLKVGHSMLQSFQSLGDELPAPLGPEFQRTVRDLQLGQGMEEALQDFKQRVGTIEVDMLVQAILIQRETGGNLVEILTNLQMMLREKLKLQGKVVTLTAQGKLSGLVIGALPFGLLFFLWVSNRPYLMEFVNHPLGMQLMMIAGLGQVAGALMICKIVNFPI